MPEAGQNPDQARPQPGLAALGGAFLVIGALAFGGQGGLLALLNRDIVERRGWATEADVAQAYTYVQLLPGAVVVQVVAFLGWKLRGARGAALAVSAFLSPSVVVMLLLAVLYGRLSVLSGVPAALNGLTAAVVGLIAWATWKQARKTITGIGGAALALAALAASIAWHVNPALLVIGAGLLGVAREAVRRGPDRRPRQEERPVNGGHPASALLLWQLFWEFTAVSLLAFGGGQAVLPLIERDSVAVGGWTTTAAFTAAVGFGYLIPGPVTTLATFIGYQAAGFPGALATTLGMFLAPTVLAALTAAGIGKFAQNRWVGAFGRGAAPAVVGLLGATLWTVGRHALLSPSAVGIAALALLLAARTKTPPVILLMGGAAAQWLAAGIRH